MNRMHLRLSVEDDVDEFVLVVVDIEEEEDMLEIMRCRLGLVRGGSVMQGEMGKEDALETEWVDSDDEARGRKGVWSTRNG